MLALNRVVWQLAAVPLVWFIPFSIMNSKGRFMWGLWLYVGFVAVIIALEIRRRPSAPGVSSANIRPEGLADGEHAHEG